MWLFFVEAYLFVLVAFTAGVVVGLVAVRIGVRRLAPPPAPKPAKPATEKKRGRRGKQDVSEPTAEAASTGGAA